MRRARLLRAGIVASAAVAACQFTPGTSLIDGSLSGGERGSVDAAPPPCQQVSWTCGSGSASNVLTACAVVNQPPVIHTCGWGCVPGAGSAKCLGVIPSGGAATPADTDWQSFGSNLLSVTLGDGTVVDGDSGTITPGRGSGTGPIGGIDYELRGPGSGIALFRFATLSMNGTIHLVGSRPIAFVVDGKVTVTAVVDATGGAACPSPGPGGLSGGAPNTDASGSGHGTASTTNNTGGGGGAYGGAGGDGGNNGGAGGSPFGDAEITMLFGGGGGAGGSTNGGGSGGGGGGGFQLVSNTGITITSGGINAGGCGGLHGTANNNGGGGGGAGGSILLEAPVIAIAAGAAIAANGGGGGQGAGMTDGSAGQLSATQALGGVAGGGSGGAGSALDGATGSNTGGKGEGGGGGVGWLRFNTLAGSGLQAGSATISPSLTSSMQGSAMTQ